MCPPRQAYTAGLSILPRMAAPRTPSIAIPPGSVVFVVNPRARHALPAAALADVFAEACHPFGLTPWVIETHSAEQARWVAAEADLAGAAAIFAYGGDGALHTVLQGIPLGSPLPLGCVPSGTANVWAAEAALPATPLAAVRAQLDALLAPPTWIDTGVVAAQGEARRFLLMAGYGLDALAVERVAPRAKRMLGKAAYGVAGALVAVGGRGLPLRLRFDAQPPIEARVGMITIGNTQLFGSVAAFTHLASAVDGQLDAVIFRGTPARALATAPLALRGLHAAAPGVSYHRFQRLSLEVTEATRLQSQLDGEVGPAGAATIEVQAGALRVLAPDPRLPIFQPPRPIG